MKKFAVVIICILLIAGLVACGGKAGDSAAEKNPYNLDYESTEIQPMSDEKASVDTLREAAKEWLEGRQIFAGTKFADYTYEDVAKHIGVDATYYYYNKQWPGRTYVWEAEDDNNQSFAIVLSERGGVWKLDAATQSLLE